MQENNYTILTIDDSNSMRRMVSFTLEQAGYLVIEAVDGLDGLEKLNQYQNIDLILTDQNMPRLDGIGFIENARQHIKYKNSPILMLTTEASDEMKQKGKKAGANGWLVKPFDPNKLLEVIKIVINKYQNK